MRRLVNRHRRLRGPRYLHSQPLLGIPILKTVSSNSIETTVRVFVNRHGVTTHKTWVLTGKGKVIPLQAYGAQRVLGRLRLPDSVTSAPECDRLSAIRTGRLYPQEYPGTHFKRHMELSDATEKIPSDTTGDRSRDLPTSSAVP
jgi:hypothetical protein